jgi:hypothetical protein
MANVDGVPLEIVGAERYRTRGHGIGVAGALVVLAHGFDVAHAGGANWWALGFRLAWGLMLVAHMRVLLRGGSVRRVRVFAALSIFVSAAAFLAILAVTGRSHSPFFAFSSVLVISLPLLLPERIVEALLGSAIVIAGSWLLLHRDGAGGLQLLGWIHAWIMSLLLGALFGASHRRTQQLSDAAAQERRAALTTNQRLVGDLREALASVKTLTGLLPVCAWCRRVRDDGGYWAQLEAYVVAHSDAKISHGMCPDCFREHYPDDPNPP